jgi:phosphodiesterase/alkaline phosphatase D-like protein
MSKFKITRRTALLGAGVVGAGAATYYATRPSSAPQIDPYEPPAADGPFRHGVASGDPDQTSVVLWTALSDDGGGYRGVEVATDEAFEDIVFAQGEDLVFVRMQPLATLKILAEGLEPGQRYFYRFRHEETYSPVGATRTLPEGGVEEFRIGLFSCSNYPAGHFNAYAHAAEEGGLDLILHLGDYIYEYAVDGYGTTNAEALNRLSEPAHEILTYEDYVERIAQYRRDPDLQAAHAAAPWVMIWDDHETANDSWSGGAENHQPETEGDWETRTQAAVRAWLDWTPTRDLDRARRWGALEVGDLATVVFLESRLTARSRPPVWEDCPIDFSGAVNEETAAGLEAWMEEAVRDPSRELLGEEQMSFVTETCAASAAAGKPWRVLANQVIMAKVKSPDFNRTMPFWVKWYARRQGVGAFLDRSRYDVDWNFDAWDGYPAARERLYAGLKAAGADILTVTGDTHNAWANDLIDAEGDRIGSEVGVTSVSSPGAFDGTPGPHMGRLFEDANEDVLYKEPYDRGWVRLTLTREAAEAEYVSMDTVFERTTAHQIKARYRIRPSQNGVVPQMERLD